VGGGRDCIRSAFHRRRSLAPLLVVRVARAVAGPKLGMVSSCLVSLAIRSRRRSLRFLDVASRSFAFRFRHSPQSAMRSIFQRNNSPIRSRVAFSSSFCRFSAGIALSVFKAFAKLSPRLSYVTQERELDEAEALVDSPRMIDPARKRELSREDRVITLEGSSATVLAEFLSRWRADTSGSLIFSLSPRACTREGSIRACSGARWR